MRRRDCRVSWGWCACPTVRILRSSNAMARWAQPRKPEKKSGWGFFGRKKAPDLRTEPAPEPRAPMMERGAPRATAQPMPPMPQVDAPRNNADDLFPDHKRDEQFEIPAFLRRQSN